MNFEQKLNNIKEGEKMPEEKMLTPEQKAKMAQEAEKVTGEFVGKSGFENQKPEDKEKVFDDSDVFNDKDIDDLFSSAF